MYKADWFLIAVIAVAFIAGYSIVSFIVKKIKEQVGNCAEKARQTQQEDARFESTKTANANCYTAHREIEESHKEQWKREKAQDSSESNKSEGEDQRYARILGLGADVSAEDVKRAYHKLLAKYHPDKVTHLGDEFKRIADLKTLEILQAYDYFKKRYGIR